MTTTKPKSSLDVAALCRLRGHARASSCLRRAASVSPPRAPEAESRCPRTSDSRPCTGCPAGRPRTPRYVTPSTPGAPLFALTFSQASCTAHFEITNGLSGDFNSFTRLLPNPTGSVDRTNTATDDPAPSLHPHYRGFPTTTSRSASRIRNGTHTHAARGLLPLTHPETRTSSVGFGLLPFHAEAADRARVASMPDTAWPVSGHPPGSSRDLVDTPVSMSPVSVSTRQQRFAHARLPDPHLTRHARLFHIAHHGRVAAPAACGGLKPPPQGDSEGPTIPHLLHSTASRSSTYIELLSTFGTHLQADAAARHGSAPTRPPRNRPRQRPCRCRRLEFTVDRHRKSTRIGTRSAGRRLSFFWSVPAQEVG